MSDFKKIDPQMSRDIQDLGIGICARPLVHGDVHLAVHLPAMMPYTQGEVGLAPIEAGVGNATIKSNAVLIAQWWPESHNSIAPPQMTVGQRVRVYRVGKTDQYLWRSAAMDADKSVQESHVLAFAAKGRNGQASPLNKQNSYMFDVSTVTREITLTTSQSNEEPVMWKLQIDAGNGKLHVQDNKGNQWFLDAVNDRHRFVNTYNTEIEINKANMNINVPDTLNIKVGNQTNIESPKINIINSETTYKNGTFKMESNEITVKCPKSSFIGNVNVGALNVNGDGGSGSGVVKGNFDIQGSQKLQGSQTIQGSLSVQGSVSFASGGTSGGVISGSYIDT